MRTALTLTAGIAVVLLAPAALAQDQGGAGAPPPPPQMAPPPPPPGHHAPPPAPNDDDNGPSDHEKYAVGHLAFGYMGFSDVPIYPATGTTIGTVSAPVAGVRYWFNEKFGLDVGIGLWEQSSSSTNGSTTTSNPSQLAIALHGGVPITFYHQKHYKFLLVPELNIGFAHSNVPGTGGAADTSLNGYVINLGARAGAEIHFGFIGIPQLALQAGLGLYINQEHVSASQSGVSASANRFTLSTTAKGNPWDIFAGSIFALYYF